MSLNTDKAKEALDKTFDEYFCIGFKGEQGVSMGDMDNEMLIPLLTTYAGDSSERVYPFVETILNYLHNHGTLEEVSVVADILNQMVVKKKSAITRRPKNIEIPS